MTRRTKWALVGILIILVYAIGFLIMFERKTPYERPPARTQADQVKVDQAMLKRIGNYTVVDSTEGIYFDLRNGNKRWIVRRS